MLRYMFLLQLIILVLLQGLVTVHSENNRKSTEIDDILYLIDPNGKYTMSEAQVECKKVDTNLINPDFSYNYIHLRNYIQQNFAKYDSFWTNSQLGGQSFLANIGMSRGEQQCSYFDKTTFKYLPTACDNRMGFICAKQLKKGILYFNATNEMYITQSDNEYNCQEAHAKCAEHKMSLLTSDQFARNIVLQNAITKHYGTTPLFWLGDNEISNYSCATSFRNDKTDLRTKFGYICEMQSVTDKSALSYRHMILIAMVCFLAVFGIIILCALKCYYRKVKSHTYETDIPQPLEKNYVMSI